MDPLAFVVSEIAREGGVGEIKVPIPPTHQQFGGLVEPDGSTPKAPETKAPAPAAGAETKGHK